jgi:hypothetical protein
MYSSSFGHTYIKGKGPIQAAVECVLLESHEVIIPPAQTVVGEAECRVETDLPVVAVDVDLDVAMETLPTKTWTSEVTTSRSRVKLDFMAACVDLII